MKTTKPASTKKEPLDDDLRDHYDVDFAKARPNRFASLPKEQTAVLLDTELSKIFRTPEDVTNALRSLVQAMPTKARKTKK